MNSQINSIEHSSIADFMEASLVKYADKPAFSCLGQTLTFSEIDEKSKAFAVWLQQQAGLSAGDRIAIQLPNINQYPIVAYGAFRAGLIIVNINPLYTSAEMQHQLKDSGAKAIVILQDLIPKLDAIKGNTGVSFVVSTGAADLLTGSTETPAGCTSLTQIIEDNQGKPLAKRPETSLDDICALQYTGGTTGVSKGACLSHRNIIANAKQSLARLEPGCKEASEIFVCPLPLYHIYAFTVNMIMMASIGNLNVLIPNPRDMDAFINAIKPFKFTAMSGINTLFVGLCMQPAFKELDFSQFKLTISGGTALTSAAVDLWKTTTGCSISEGYGLSETSPVLCLNEPGHEVIGTVGKPVEGTDLQLWDENDQVVEEGQIVVKGPQVMSGYWNMPEETAKMLTAEGYFKTGDVGVINADGTVKIVDRLKDMIIVSGFNVYPNEIEEVLTRHEGIVEAAVIGEADDKTGEKVCAYIAATGSMTEEQVIAHCKAFLTAYKVPKKVVFMVELPKSTVGKILRRELRA